MKQRLAQTFYELLEVSPESDHPRLIRSFVAYLQRKRMLSQAPRILRDFTLYTEQKQKGARLLVEAAHDIAVQDATVTVRTNLLAGARVREGDRIVDASAKGRLQQLRKQLTS